MAGGAGCELNSGIPRLAIIARGMTFLAVDFAMCSGKRVARPGVVEALLIDLRRLPVDGGMAGLAFSSEAPLVLVLVTGDATR